MRTSIVLAGLIALSLQSAAAETVPIPDGGYRVSLKPGDETDFNQLHVVCGPDRMTVTFGEDKNPNSGSEAFGRGFLEAAFGDCQMTGGDSIRVKAGFGNVRQSTGECGYDPEKVLSIWIGRRKIVSRKQYVKMCSEYFLKSIDIDAQGATICTLGLDDSKPKDFVELPEKGACIHTPADAGSVDPVEFDPHTLPSDTLTPKGAQPALCKAMIKGDRWNGVAVPAGFARPAWVDVPPHKNDIDEAKLKFNATSFALFGTREARFDLENTGHVQTVYQHEQDDHWFAGSALANARPGILDVPFDAHDWDRSWKSGIYAYVYDHATVFFDRGRTYLLLAPENKVLDPRIVTLRDGKETEVCRLVRQPENF